MAPQAPPSTPTIIAETADKTSQHLLLATATCKSPEKTSNCKAMLPTQTASTQTSTSAPLRDHHVTSLTIMWPSCGHPALHCAALQDRPGEEVASVVAVLASAMKQVPQSWGHQEARPGQTEVAVADMLACLARWVAGRAPH